MLLDDEIPSLESIDPGDALDFEARLAALEASLDKLASRQDSSLLERIRQLEEALANQEFERRRELSAESAAHNEQIAKLAMKLSRFIDHFRLPA